MIAQVVDSAIDLGEFNVLNCFAVWCIIAVVLLWNKIK